MYTAQRRDFLKAAGVSAASISVTGDVAQAAANERVVVGVIGPGGMGTRDGKRPSRSVQHSRESTGVLQD
jgi:hypothetical protein